MSDKKSSSKGLRTPYRLRPIAPVVPVDQPGRLRFANLMALFAVSHQTLRNRIRDGLIPNADGHDGARPYWFNETIRPYLHKSAD